MKLRMPGYDYRRRGYYFCTLVVRGRRPLFGRVVAVEENTLRSENEGQNTAGAAAGQGASAAGQGAGRVVAVEESTLRSENEGQNTAGAAAGQNTTGAAAGQGASAAGQGAPLVCSGAGARHQSLCSVRLAHGSSHPHFGACVAYSPFGALVVRHIEAMAHRPELEGHLFVKGRIVMPDHIHLLLYIHDSLERPLGSVLNGFNAGVRHLWHQLEHGGLPADQSVVPQLQADGSLSIFESGYNDGVVLKEGQLNAYYDYMRMNPFRLLQRQLHPDLFTRRWGRELLSGVRFDLFGNMFLLQRPWREAVRISRFATIDHGTRDIAGQTQYILPRRLKTEEEVMASLQPYLSMARKGAVLITPCISPAEQALVQAAYAERLPVIMLVARGFSEGYHPSKAHYDACAQGLLLQISPWRYNPGRQFSKELCELLNGFASQLAENRGM